MDFLFVYFLAVLGFVHCKLIDLGCGRVEKFVNGHNTRRLQLARGKLPGQVAALKMNVLIWDKELAAKAGRWANKDVYAHNPSRDVRSGRFKTGENIYRFGSTSPDYELDLDLALKSWWDEYKDYNYKVLEWTDFSPDGPDVGHYTQMAWANTTYVGCAISKYHKDEWNYYFVVCNYGPAGNIIGQAPYEAGRGRRALSCGCADCSRPFGDAC